MKIKASAAMIFSLIIGIMGIYWAMGSGIWDSGENEKIPAKFEGVAGLEDQYRADDIRGSYTFGEISQLYNVPINVLAEAFQIEENKAAGFKMKDLSTVFPEEETEIGTGSVKLFVAFYLGQPYDLGDSSTLITANGASIIRANGKASAEQLAYLDTHILGMEPITDNLDDVAEPLEEKIVSPNEKNVAIGVSGSDYFKDLAAEYDIPLEDLSGAFGVAGIKAPFYQVKDLKNDFDSNIYKVNANSVKMFIAFYKGYQFDLSNAQSQILAAGADILKERGVMLPEQAEYLESHIVE